MTPSSGTLLLAGSAASVGVVHTLVGPDHYLPFVALSKARGWSRRKTVVVTGACGLGHVGSSILLALLGVWAGKTVERLAGLEALRGQLVSWGLLIFGLTYGLWGLLRASRGKRHQHLHAHVDGGLHDHDHGHEADHLHPHDRGGSFRSAPWVLFVLFVFGPCEPLIPLVMATYATSGWGATALVSTAFTLATLACMLSLVWVGLLGVRSLEWSFLEEYAHALAGGTLALCGAGMLFLGW